MNILDRINSSNDVKALDDAEAEKLCSELREFIIDKVSKTGGHLASNLGAVELTVALHRVYDSSKDRILFDVGHQAYAHKIMTGRRDSFATLRTHGGISGFPKPCEAADDAFIAGHASDSISLALGMARARTINKDDYDVVAVIGDGALTGGLAYEGLINVAGSTEPMVIILNDNGMSISSNVGGISKLLSRQRTTTNYINFKRWYRRTVGAITPVYNANHKLKELLKKSILPPNIFDSMGIYYLGPVDGHDVKQLETVIQWAKELKTPVLVHVITTKGKGCKYAEEHPDKYHGVGPFDANTGEVYNDSPSFSTVFGNKLCEIAQKNDKVVALSAAMSAGTGLSRFANEYPKRFFDVGIAEQHAVTMAAGMAKQGLIPVVAIYSSFLQRGYDSLIHDTSLLGLHTVFCVDRAGLVGSDGETHHGVFDLSYLSSVPNMRILAPASFAELEVMLDKAVNEIVTPVAVRYPRGGEGEYKGVSYADTEIISSGSDITLIAYGTMINTMIKVADKLNESGVSAEVIKLSSLKPIAFEPIAESLGKTEKVLIAEDVCSRGCVGSEILSEAELHGIKLKKAMLCNLGEGIVSHGKVSELMTDCGLDADSLYEKAMSLVRGAM